MKRNTQVQGHGLWFEGAAFDSHGRRVQSGTGGLGQAKCRCGWMSDVLSSGGARRRAHAEHKRQVQEAAS